MSSLSFAKHFFYSQFLITPQDPDASFAGQTVIVTGANAGLGLETTRSLVARGATRVILACRNTSKGDAAAADIRSTTSCAPETLEVWPLDMCSYASILSFADRVHKELPALHTLVANAGVNNTVFRTAERDEQTITVNVVGTYLLAFLLFPKLKATAAAEGVQTHCSIVGSDTYEMGALPERNAAPQGKLFETLADESKSDMGNRYPTSKLLVMLMGRQLASMAPSSGSNVIVNVSNPGLTHSRLGAEDMGRGLMVRTLMNVFARSTPVGARTLVLGASAGPEAHGKFISDGMINEPNLGLAGGDVGAQLQERVWAELREKLEAIRPGVTSLA